VAEIFGFLPGLDLITNFNISRAAGVVGWLVVKAFFAVITLILAIISGGFIVTQER